MQSIELFTGAGGLALGTHYAGFHHRVVIEHDHDACDTLRLNTARGDVTGVDWTVREADVSDVDYRWAADQIDLLAGGAPCQPFSLGGKHAGQSDKRNLFPEVFRAMREIYPRAFVLENVRGLARESFRPYFNYIIDQLTYPALPPHPDESWEDHWGRLQHTIQTDLLAVTQSYDVTWDLCNVADFGVPQERHRIFIVGFRRDVPIQWNFPHVTHSKDALLYAQYVDGSYWEEHGLPPQPVPDRFAKRVQKLASQAQPFYLRWRTVRDAIKDLPEPVDYDSQPPFDNHVGIPDARIYPGHTGSPWDWPAKTIKAGDHGNPGGENMLRREDGSVRYFTVRELARLQTFPDDWHFANSWTESRRQLGNAVPVSVAEQVGQSIYQALAQSAPIAAIVGDD